MDAQGPAKARPYVEKARTTFPTVVDEDNTLGTLFGFKAIPNGVFVDETGIIRYTKFSGFDIRKGEFAQVSAQFARSQSLAELEQQAQPASGFRTPEALDLFRQGLALYRAGQPQEAVAVWRKGVELEPDNFIIRKQVWAVENPDRFYVGEVDYTWQREQMEQGR